MDKTAELFQARITFYRTGILCQEWLFQSKSYKVSLWEKMRAFNARKLM